MITFKIVRDFYVFQNKRNTINVITFFTLSSQAFAVTKFLTKLLARQPKRSRCPDNIKIVMRSLLTQLQ